MVSHSIVHNFESEKNDAAANAKMFNRKKFSIGSNNGNAGGGGGGSYRPTLVNSLNDKNNLESGVSITFDAYRQLMIPKNDKSYKKSIGNIS